MIDEGTIQKAVALLQQAAHRAALSPRFQEFYQRQRERHGTRQAIVALARKLATIAYHRWRAARPAAPTSSGAHLRRRVVETSSLWV